MKQIDQHFLFLRNFLLVFEKQFVQRMTISIKEARCWDNKGKMNKQRNCESFPFLSFDSIPRNLR